MLAPSSSAAGVFLVAFLLHQILSRSYAAPSGDEDEMQTFDTSDYQLAVTLISLGYRLNLVDKSIPQRAVFRFEAAKDIQADSEAFFQDRLTLNPRTVLTNAKLVKGRLHAGV